MIKAMQFDAAISALSALSHPARLETFRALVKAGPNGIAAGDLADRVKHSPSSMSFHLNMLEQAGLVRSTRQGRFILYAVEVDVVRGLLNFLAEDCCDGRPELCGNLMNPLETPSSHKAERHPA